MSAAVSTPKKAKKTAPPPAWARPYLERLAAREKAVDEADARTGELLRERTERLAAAIDAEAHAGAEAHAAHVAWLAGSADEAEALELERRKVVANARHRAATQARLRLEHEPPPRSGAEDLVTKGMKEENRASALAAIVERRNGYEAISFESLRHDAIERVQDPDLFVAAVLSYAEGYHDDDEDDREALLEAVEAEIAAGALKVRS